MSFSKRDILHLDAENKKHAFWDTQPVNKLSWIEDLAPVVSSQIEQKQVDQIRTEPYRLPEGFEWITIDLNDEEQAQNVYELLRDNYVEDDDNMFRFDYSIPFLRWALMPPGFFPELHVAVRAVKS